MRCAAVLGGAIWLVRPIRWPSRRWCRALHLGWQVVTLQPDDGAGALYRFRSNRFAGLLMALACVVVGSSL